MFSRWGERSGLFNFLAPRKSKKRDDDAKKQFDDDGSSPDDEFSEGDQEEQVAVARQENNEEEEPEPSQEQDPEQLLRVQREGAHKRRVLENQRQREIEAAERGAFIKKQRVQYLSNKEKSIWVDAVIVGAHLDDGPDHPYYTIKYDKEVASASEDEQATTRTIEKQTTPDRLQRVPWNEELTWTLIED